MSITLLGCQAEQSTSGAAQPTVYRTDLANLRLPTPVFDYTPSLPEHFTNPADKNYKFAGAYDNMPANNPTTDAGATLGRVLFYDKRLSANGTKACASCHQQALGFSDNAILSEGFQGSKTRRHSMGLANARYYPNGRFFWDERAATLEQQVLMPIQDSVEMGMSLTTLVGLLNALPEYQKLFHDAFGSEQASEERIAFALAQFVRSLVSYQSKFDRALINGWDILTDQEFRGAQLFIGACQGCHKGPMQNGTQATVNGIDDITTDLDRGLAEVTLNQADDGKFKTPSLRNIAVTAPYMHDGRFNTLEQVLTQYLSNVQSHVNLDKRLKSDNGSPIVLPLVDRQKADILAFFDTLTDHALLADEKFSNPFISEFE